MIFVLYAGFLAHFQTSTTTSSKAETHSEPASTALSVCHHLQPWNSGKKSRMKVEGEVEVEKPDSSTRISYFKE